MASRNQYLNEEENDISLQQTSYYDLPPPSYAQVMSAGSGYSVPNVNSSLAASDGNENRPGVSLTVRPENNQSHHDTASQGDQLHDITSQLRGQYQNTSITPHQNPPQRGQYRGNTPPSTSNYSVSEQYQQFHSDTAIYITQPQFRPQHQQVLQQQQISNDVASNEHSAYAVCVCIFCFLPFGLPAVIASHKCEMAYRAGNVLEARQLSKTTLLLSNMSVITGIIIILLVLLSVLF